MKKRLVSMAAIAAAVIFGLSSIQVDATSVTTSTEVVSVVIGNEDQQVLGARREGIIGQDVTLGAITVQDALDKLSDLEAIARVISAYTGREIHAKDIAILDSMDVKPAPDLDVSAANPVSITFSFPGLTASTRAYVLHYETDNWVVMPTTVGDGVATGTFTSLSPVALVVEKATLKSSVLGANRAVSPRTGEENAFPYYMIISCAVVLLGAGFAYRKRHGK